MSSYFIIRIDSNSNNSGCRIVDKFKKKFLPCHYSAYRRIFQAFRLKKGEVSLFARCGQHVDRHCGKLWKKKGSVEKKRKKGEKKSGERVFLINSILKTGRLSTEISTMWIKLSRLFHNSTQKNFAFQCALFGGSSCFLRFCMV